MLADILIQIKTFLAKVSFQILLTRPAVNEDEDEDRVELTHYFLRLAPWIDGGHQDEVRGTLCLALRSMLRSNLCHFGVRVGEVRRHLRRSVLPSVWSRSTSSRMASMIEDLLPRKRAQAPRGRSVTAASALGARGSSRGTARTAGPRRPQMRSST